MHLRSGNRLGIGKAPSLATTQGSETQPTVRSTQMNLHLANGRLKNSIGILENVALTTCGIEYTHSFAVVDFGQEANYKLILGQRFMQDRKSTRLNSSHSGESRMPSSA